MSKPDDLLLEPGQQVTDCTTFVEVFRRYYAPLVRYARGITGDAASAADVLQDVFLKLWEDRERLTIESSLKAMLYTMVRNRALNLNRRQKRTVSLVVEEVPEPDAVDSDGERTVVADELRHYLYRWIDELPPRRKEAFTLSRYHGLSHSEIADLMDISERTVDTHIVLALRELRRRLDELQAKGASS